ncbi:5-methyltetrahydropteroyltriglutamate--homocysteine S-methyltransferase [Segniliparus rotundus DSM 44985]|uniref:5-methyltetrahydropteroyltriglutamate--homocysteine S-methyltransferase n=1 Tax=Segniliparus rotundus (strain ATCC BAA-972 / CDC 1076 / CIP 108378 / DSM 44985 / JCM 13578) TaxID=640132 RepID=D6Z8T8_SEGRD|nr:5-methyltetrahydropteroyltriglutamate--homocysteine S-methyltransferase [Segniliparus rotundus]ADG98368.1 5-methyltetrahydropteroyltriglutamate--homocysteine S-methyltransferase [Segniliparus rotundus DSM 44985]
MSPASAPVETEYGSSILGYPRIGPRRELKRALEGYFHGPVTKDELKAVGLKLRDETWQELAAMGLEQVPGNTFSFYDHILDSAVLFGAVSPRYVPLRAELDDLDFYFTMCRGRADFPPLELVKLFGTNYHYRQPEISEDTAFAVSSYADELLAEHARAKTRGVELRPVVLGPVSLLLLSKRAPEAGADFRPVDRLSDLLPAYLDLLERLAKQGAKCVQFDEPAFTSDRGEFDLELLGEAYAKLSSPSLAARPRMLVTGQYGHLGDALPVLASSNVEAISLDLVAAPIPPEELAALPGLRRKRLYAGVVSGRNIWRNDRLDTLGYLTELKNVVPDIVVSTSTTLLHVPYDVLAEYDLPEELDGRLAFAKQKVGEVVALTKALREGAPASWSRTSPAKPHVNQAVRDRVAAVKDEDRVRPPYEERRALQEERFQLPKAPTTTLGSFPQTPHIRRARYELGEGRLSWEEYRALVRDEIERIIRLQEDIGLDVLVHGEVERNDMVQYFAELLEGFATTRHGWVQVYGTRSVRPPIIYGDVSRRKPMTVEWITHAQSFTSKPVKGVLTGPVTMLARSFAREDLPQQQIADQIALVVRDEIEDLEQAGIGIIQVDEPAIRELLPLRAQGRRKYLDWAVAAFRLATAGARPATQIHTHLEYSSLGLVVEAFEQMDCDVTALVATRSISWVLQQLRNGGLTRDVGPGVYESRSARIPDIDELDERIAEALKFVEFDRLWVNPDGGLKTRHYWQLQPSLRNMVAAARRHRRRSAALGQA